MESQPTAALHPRMDREARTIEAMVRIYCKHKHDARQGLCTDCQELLDYALLRLEKCPFQEEKSTCVNCSVHCYRGDMRARIRDVMRYSGPHMMYRHPYLAFMHLAVDSRRAAPDLAKRQDRAG